MRKTLGRHPAVIRLGSFLLSSYLRFVYATLRWTIEGQDHARSVWRDKSTGAMLLLWHQGIPLSPTTWPPREGGQDMRALISRSADGEFIAQVVNDLGFPAFRGSRQRENSVGEKGGAAALREMVKWVKGGGAVAITPDGPKGPARVMGDGPPTAARLSGAPVILVGIACNPCKRIRSWDKTILPLPFGKGAIVYHPVLRAERDADLAVIARDWSDKLNSVTDRAEALVT